MVSGNLSKILGTSEGYHLIKKVDWVLTVAKGALLLDIAFHLATAISKDAI